MIEAKDIRKSFEGAEVLRGISTVFERGKTNLIIGQSGAGKTVFLKTLTGLVKPDSGDIYYDGVAYSSMDEGQRENLRQHCGLWPEQLYHPVCHHDCHGPDQQPVGGVA